MEVYLEKNYAMIFGFHGPSEVKRGNFRKPGSGHAATMAVYAMADFSSYRTSHACRNVWFNSESPFRVC